VLKFSVCFHHFERNICKYSFMQKPKLKNISFVAEYFKQRYIRWCDISLTYYSLFWNTIKSTEEPPMISIIRANRVIKLKYLAIIKFCILPESCDTKWNLIFDWNIFLSEKVDTITEQMKYHSIMWSKTKEFLMNPMNALLFRLIANIIVLFDSQTNYRSIKVSPISSSLSSK